MKSRSVARSAPAREGWPATSWRRARCSEWSAASLGLALAWGGVRLLVAFGPADLPRLNEVRIDPVVVVFTAALSLLAALVFGAIPLLRLAPITAALHDSGRGQTATRGQHRARQLLMTAQVALALVLLVASGLMVRSVQQLGTIDLGFDPSSALSFRVGLPARGYETRERAALTHRAILERLNALPGVVAASAVSCLPLSGTCFGNGLIVEGERDGSNQLGRQFAWFRAVADGYFEAAGLRLTRGRALGQTDIDRAEPVVVIDEALAAMYFPDQDPIGKRVRSARTTESETETADAAMARDRRRRVEHADRRADLAPAVAADVHADVDRRRAGYPRAGTPRARHHDDDLRRPIDNESCRPRGAGTRRGGEVSIRTWHSRRCARCRRWSIAPRIR